MLALVEAPVPDDDVADETFWHIIRAHPLCQAQLRGRFDALKLSDFHTRRSLHRTELYADWFRPAGVEYELELALPRVSSTRRRSCSTTRGATSASASGRCSTCSSRTSSSSTATPRCAGAPRPRAEVDALTPREQEVLRLVGDGLRNADIAEALWVSPATVRKHLENIYDKLGVHTRTAAAAYLQRQERV